MNPFYLLQVARVRRGEQFAPPVRAHNGDAGWDIHMPVGFIVPPGVRKDIPTNFKVAIPDGFWLLITGRSSTFPNTGLMVMQSVIDSGYRGEIHVAVFNPTNEVKVVGDGQRIAQMIMVPVPEIRMEVVETLPWGDRQDEGFGSTGY